LTQHDRRPCKAVRELAHQHLIELDAGSLQNPQEK
jgi:hypothetical protein